jgi:RNAse (barnase) inhibitor barstar
MERESLVEISLAEVHDAASLHAVLQDALHFPSWYGCNWDAFWDAITGLVQMPQTLRLLGWSDLQSKLPRDAALLKQCLDEMAQQYPESAPHVLFE